MKIYFLNDRALFNQRYRSSLMKCFSDRDFKLVSLGFFDGAFSFVLCFYVMIFKKYVFSSNLKSNILFLLFFWRDGFVILNGLGRIRSIRAFRIFFVSLLRLNRSKRIFVQNYHDYRYFSRYVCSKNIVWVIGSGGSPRKVSGDAVTVVSRPDKVSSVISSVVEFKTRLRKKIALVGVNFLDCDIEPDIGCVGYLPQSDIFLHGSEFFQPVGYGEGFPHSLADALSSSMIVYIPKLYYVRLGLYKFADDIDTIDSYVKLEPLLNCRLVSEVSQDTVNTIYCMDFFRR